MKLFSRVNISGLIGFFLLPPFFLIFYADDKLYSDSSGLLSLFYVSIICISLYALIRLKKINLKSFLFGLCTFILSSIILYFFVVIIVIMLMGISLS